MDELIVDLIYTCSQPCYLLYIVTSLTCPTTMTHKKVIVYDVFGHRKRKNSSSKVFAFIHI